MKTNLHIGFIAAVTTSLCAADSSPKDQLTQAAKQLAAKPNYSWTTSTKEADGSSGRLGDITGKTEKEGVTFLSFSPGGVAVEVYMKGDKGAALDDQATGPRLGQPGTVDLALLEGGQCLRVVLRQDVHVSPARGVGPRAGP